MIGTRVGKANWLAAIVPKLHTRMEGVAELSGVLYNRLESCIPCPFANLRRSLKTFMSKYGVIINAQMTLGIYCGVTFVLSHCVHKQLRGGKIPES